MARRRSKPARRPPLSRAAVIEAAVAVADSIGLEKLTMRRLAEHLGVQPMSIYHHVADKDDILDGIVDRVFSEIDRPGPADGDDGDWVSPIRRYAHSARHVLAAHPWAVPLLESRRNPGAETLAHHDAVLGCLRRAGLSLELTAHVYALVDAFVYGFAIQEASLPATAGDEMAELAGSIVASMDAHQYPHLAELATEHASAPGYDFGHEFEWGLDVILDALITRTTT